MIIGDKRALTLYNVEYEMTDASGQLVTWKANILSRQSSDDAIKFIMDFTKKRITVLSVGTVANIDGITDKALDYIARVPR